MTYGAVICLYDDHEYLEPCLFPIYRYLEKVLFLISDVPWNGEIKDNSKTIEYVQELCQQNPSFELIQGHWTNEIDQRNFGLEKLYEGGIDYCFVLDNDEIYHEHHFRNIISFIESHSQYDAFHLEWNTYWKKSYHRIEPREHFKPLICVRVAHFKFTIIRGGTTGICRTGSLILKRSEEYNAVLIPPHIAICYHLSYARTDTVMKRKFETNSHAPEFIPDWYENVWLQWKEGMRNLHPVTPEQYGMAVKEDLSRLPVQLRSFIKREQNRKCSIIILNWNSLDLLKRCLGLIEKNTYGGYEIILIDNGSTDGSVEYIKGLGLEKVQFNDENLGFVKGVNQGIRMAPEDTDICLLNVDAEVQEGWFEEMYKTLERFADAGLVGPLGNEVPSGHQREGYVIRDCITPNLYGYCLLILREVIEKIGYFDEQYEIGGYEDNDYCIRAKLAGYESYISSRALVRHKAHQVFEKNGLDSERYEMANRERYLNKFFGVLLDYGRRLDLYLDPDLCRQTRLRIF